MVSVASRWVVTFFLLPNFRFDMSGLTVRKCLSSRVTVVVAGRWNNGLLGNVSRNVHSTSVFNKFNQPTSPQEMTRPAGIASFMRLPVQSSAEGLSVAIVGVPIDTGTSNRPGARFGPRQIRWESSFLRPFNYGTKAAPFESFQIADVGDVRCNLYDLPKAIIEIRSGFADIINANGDKSAVRSLAIGGDHTISFPILQAIKDRHGPVGLVHVDAHGDTGEHMMGHPIAHGTPFRRAVECGTLDCQRVVQIGLRGTGYGTNDLEWPKQQGFRIVGGEECWNRSLVPLMAEVREQMGDKPVYLSFDIDAIDPGFAPGTGTPEIAGLTPIQALEIIRGCRGLNIVGADLVEVSPAYDRSGNTALLAANLLFEILCVFPGVKYHD